MMVAGRLMSAAMLVCVILVTPLAHASFLSDDVYVPSVGRGGGAAGSFWYTTVWFHNPGSESNTMTVSLLLRGQANLSPDQQVVTVPAGSVLTFKDAIFELFGLDNASGALRIQAGGPIAVSSRVFNQPGDTVSESQGQLMPGYPAGFSIGAGESVEVPGITSPADGSFRSNFGFVETSGSSALVQVTLFDNDGTELGTGVYSIGPYQAFQRSVQSIIPNGAVDGGLLRVEVAGDTGAILVFASAVASGVQSQDPTTLEMTLDAQGLGGGQGGGITSVEAGPGLGGGGDEGDVTLFVVDGEGIDVSESGVAIEEGGVTAEHLAPTALGCLGTRIETTLSQSVIASEGGLWFRSTGGLDIPSAGRWRVGYQALVEVRNAAYNTVTDPINVALFESEDEVLIRNSISVVGMQIDVGLSVFITVSGEAAFEVDGPTTVVLAARTSRSDIVATLHPHHTNLSAGLPDPDTASFIFAECLYSR